MAVDVREYVKLIKSELKDGKKQNKIEGIVLYSIQEALKESKKEKGVAETFRSEQFRGMILKLIEASLRFAGYLHTIAVFGNKFSYDAKYSRHTMSLF